MADDESNLFLECNVLYHKILSEGDTRVRGNVLRRRGKEISRGPDQEASAKLEHLAQYANTDDFYRNIMDPHATFKSKEFETIMASESQQNKNVMNLVKSENGPPCKNKKCKSTKTSVTSVQTRGLDELPDTYVQCHICDYKWKL